MSAPSLVPGSVAIWESVPADVVFADAEGVIRYVSPYRIFSTTSAVIGSHVLDCHASSREMLREMLADFESGIRDEHVYQVKKDGRDVIVRDLAVRDESGVYRGCVEFAVWADTDRS